MAETNATVSSRVQSLVGSALAELLREQGSSSPVVAETVVFGGPGAALDSMGLVNLIADLEARVEAEFGVNLVLADDRAMSRTRSPFRTVATISAHIETLLAGTSA